MLDMHAECVTLQLPDCIVMHLSTQPGKTLDPAWQVTKGRLPIPAWQSGSFTHCPQWAFKCFNDNFKERRQAQCTLAGGLPASTAIGNATQ
jgi:hypothetical protein